MAAKRRFKHNPGNTAIAYYRYSSSSQSDALIEEQKAEVMKYATQHGYNLVKEYADRAISRINDERPEFKLMLSEANQLRPAYLILWDTKSFSRDCYDAVISKATLRAAGVKIVYITGGIPDNDEATQNPLEAIYEAMEANYITWSSRKRNSYYRK